MTLQDTEERRRYLNARATLGRLIAMRAVPVINENDTVATSEIRYGDNDRLAARVATMASADLLILLSDVAGLYSAPPSGNAQARLLPVVEKVTPEIETMAGGAASELSRGGMRTKIEAARIATSAGTHMVIADGRVPHPIARVADGRALHLVPDAVEPRRGAQDLDRRVARTEGLGVRRRRAPSRRSPAARASCRRASPGSRASSRAATASPSATSTEPRSVAGSSPMTRCTPSASAAASRATSRMSSGRPGAPK